MNKIILVGMIFAVLSVVFAFTGNSLLYIPFLTMSIICLIIHSYRNIGGENGE